MTRVVNHGRFIVPLLCFVTATAVAKNKEIEFVPGQYVVQLNPKLALAAGANLEEKMNGKLLGQVRGSVFLIQRATIERPESAIATLRDLSFVELAEPNYIYHALRMPNDPDYSQLWGLRNTGALDARKQKGLPEVDISAEAAWDITTGSKKVVVAVIDTGIDFGIADLKDQAWTNEAELNGKPGVDDDNNGYVDDVHGYDFANNDGDSTDDHSHGSHCAGTIGAKGNDGVGVAGVNWDVTMMGVKFLDANGSGSLANAVKAIDYARKAGAKIMSNSWGGGGESAVLKKAIEDARDAGILFVAAAGNDGSDNDEYPTFPANYPVDNVLAVAAIDNRGELADFSNWGLTKVHVAAPGVNILSTTPSGQKVYSGTSMATPHVSGVAALVASRDPSISYVDLKNRLVSSVRKTKSLTGKIISGGIVNAYSALTGIATPDKYDASAWPDQRTYALSSPSPYPAKFSQVYTVQVPGARHVAVRFAKFKTEANFDFMTFTNSAGESLGQWSGEKAVGTYSPIADGDTLVLTFTSDDNVQFEGFTVDGVAAD